MSVTVRFDDLPALAAIAATGFGDWHAPLIIDAERVAAFARITGTHADDGTIPGNLLQAMLPLLVPDRGWTLTGHAGAVNLGGPGTRFPAAAKVGATLRARFRLAEATPHARGTLITLDYEARQAGAAEPCLLTAVQLLYLRSGS